MKVGTPLGEYPFEFRRVERRGKTIVVIGIVAGLESSVTLDAGDLRSVLKYAAPATVAAGLLVAYLARTRGSDSSSCATCSPR
jgi:hypothetical protein